MKDRYKILNDYPNYRIYDDGRIFSIKQNKFLKPHDDGRGYLDVVLYRGKKEDRKAVKIHVLVARLFVPNPYNNREVNHIDGNKQNNHYTNLEWVTNQENRNHAIKYGLHTMGEDCSWSKLNNDKVKELVKQ